MANCCYERYCLLNPRFKCCYRNIKPIVLEIIYLIGQIIVVIFLIWGKADIPWKLYRKSDSDVIILIDDGINYNKPYLKVFYTIGFITGIIKLAFFVIILILRIIKLINGAINIIVLIFCYIIYHIDNIGACLINIALIIIIVDFAKIYSDYGEYINPFEKYPAVLSVFIVNTIFEIAIQLPFQIDIQLIRFKTDLSYGEYKNQNQVMNVQINNGINDINDTMVQNIKNGAQEEHITVQNNLNNLNGTQNQMNIPSTTQNINGQQNPQNQ